MDTDQHYRGRRLDDWIKSIVDEIQDNGEKTGLISRVKELEENQMSRSDLKEIFREVQKEDENTFRRNWNQWVNTGLLLATVLGVFFGPEIIGG